MSRARADLLWLSTNSARSFTFGVLVPASIFSMTGSACSGSLFMIPRSASSLSSSSFCASGDTVWPDA